jgi:hypothetical protein
MRFALRFPSYRILYFPVRAPPQLSGIYRAAVWLGKLRISSFSDALAATILHSC